MSCAVIIFVCSTTHRHVQECRALHQVAERGGLLFLFIWVFLLFTSTFADMMIASIDTAEAGSNLANMLFSMCLIFCGVLASPTALPGFWIFMYRVSPFTYLVDGILSVGLANALVTCSDIEYLDFDPPSGLTCGEYLVNYTMFAGGYVNNPEAMTSCDFCTVRDTNTLLAGLGLNYDCDGETLASCGRSLPSTLRALWSVLLARVPKKPKDRPSHWSRIAREGGS